MRQQIFLSFENINTRLIEITKIAANESIFIDAYKLKCCALS